MSKVISFPDRGKGDREFAREVEQIGQVINEQTGCGDWRWERRYRLHNGTATPEWLEESEKARDRQDEIIGNILSLYREWLGMPQDNITDICFWLYEHVEDLRGRSPLFEEYYWLCRQMDYQKSVQVRERNLRVIR